MYTDTSNIDLKFLETRNPDKKRAHKKSVQFSGPEKWSEMSALGLRSFLCVLVQAP